MKTIRKSSLLLLLLLSLAVSCQAATISWWRFEDGEDDDPSAAGLRNPNEISGEPDMVSSNALITTDAPSLFASFIPLYGTPNTGSVRSYTNGNSTDGIFGTAAYSSTLDVNSITVEFWLRTTEGEAGFVARTTNATLAGETGNLTNGFRIVEPQNLRVNYWVSNMDGSSPTQYTLTSGIAVNNGAWHYVAFRYNHTTGLAELILNGGVVASYDGPDNRRMWWGPTGSQPEVIIGHRMDGMPNNTVGTLDEIRFSNVALANSELLIVPESSSHWAGLATLLFVSAFVVSRRLRKRTPAALRPGQAC